MSRKVDRRQHFRCNSAPASISYCGFGAKLIAGSIRIEPSQHSASSENNSRIGGGDSEKLCDKQTMCEDAPCADSFGIGDTVAATSDFCIGGALAVEKGCRGAVKCHGERPDGSIGVSVQFEAWKDGREVNVLCKPHEIEVVAKAPSADSFGIGDTVAATSDFRIGGALAVEKGCRGVVICHGERPDGSIGVSIQFEAWKDGREATVLCKPHEIQVVAKAPSADSFGMGDTVATTSAIRIGGALAVEKGCRGTVISHGERPDGSIGVSVQFKAWKDGRDAKVLCQPHEVQVVAKAVHAQPKCEYATLLEHHLRGAWKSIRGSVISFREILPSSPMQCMFENLALVSKQMSMGRSSTPVQRRKVKKRRKGNDDDDFDDILEEMVPSDTSQQHPRWSLLIAVLICVNLLLGYVRIHRRAGEHNLHAVKVLTDDSFAYHIAANPNGTLVHFFSSPCEPCAKLAPEFEKAAKQLRKTMNVSLASVNAALAPSTFEQYLVRRLPTLLWFRRGRLVQDVAHLRSAGEISEFVHEALQPAVIEFRSYAEFVEAVPQLRTVLSKGKTPPIVAGFGPDPAVHELLEQVGEKFRGETAFLFVPEARHNDPSIRAYFRDATADKDYNGSLKVDDFLNWLQPFMVE